MILILLLALLGFLFGGLRGFLIGGLIGFLVSQVLPYVIGRGLRAVQSKFVDSTFAVVGALCKADGVVTRDEIQFAEQLFVRLGLNEQQTQAAKAAFNRGKAPDFDLDAEVDEFVRLTRGNHALLFLFLRVQMMAVAADGEVHEKEVSMLRRIARRLGLPEAEIARIEAMLRAASADANAQPPGASGFPPTSEQLNAAYATLGLSEEASEAEIKTAYKRLMRENHPDRLASKGLPDSMRELAEERSREINAAYERLKKARGFS